MVHHEKLQKKWRHVKTGATYLVAGMGEWRCGAGDVWSMHPGAAAADRPTRDDAAETALGRRTTVLDSHKTSCEKGKTTTTTTITITGANNNKNGWGVRDATVMQWMHSLLPAHARTRLAAGERLGCEYLPLLSHLHNPCFNYILYAHTLAVPHLPRQHLSLSLFCSFTLKSQNIWLQAAKNSIALLDFFLLSRGRLFTSSVSPLRENLKIAWCREHTQGVSLEMDQGIKQIASFNVINLQCFKKIIAMQFFNIVIFKI
jgi:hypothetical protein